MLVQSGWFVFGLVLLVLGADSFIRGASGVALRFGLSPFVVGLVLVGFGTSAPELTVNLTAAWTGHYDLAVGNVVGSNIANVGLILGATALFMPLAVHMRLIKIEAPLLIVVSAGLWLLCRDGLISRGDGALLLTGLAGLLVLMTRDARVEPVAVRVELAGAAQREALPMWRCGLRLFVGLALLLYGSALMVDAAVAMARVWGLSELVIGLTVVAIGTSLPELASSTMAALRKETDIAVGNVIGSCLFNILAILGATAFVHPLPAARTLVVLELPVMLLFAAVMYPMMRGDLRIGRREGAFLLAAWGVFIAYQVYAAVS